VDIDETSTKPRVDLGHVVVSSRIIGYDHRKKKPDHDEPRGFEKSLEEYQFYQSLTKTLIKHDWEKGLHFGQVLSGSWLFADENAQKLVSDPWQKDVIAVEMEGVGIAAACVKTVVECLVVKGVSDYANRNKDDTWQPAAARNATRYLSDMINKVML